MRGTQLFEVSIDGHITTKSNRKITDWNDRLETKFSNLDSFPSTRRIAIDAKFWISSTRFRESGALDLDNLIGLSNVLKYVHGCEGLSCK